MHDAALAVDFLGLPKDGGQPSAAQVGPPEARATRDMVPSTRVAVEIEATKVLMHEICLPQAQHGLYDYRPVSTITLE